MPRRVTPVIILGLTTVIALSLALSSGAQMLEEVPAEVLPEDTAPVDAAPVDAAPAEAAPVDSALPAAPADAALAVEEGQGASSPTPMSGGGSGGEALSVGEAQLGKPFVLNTDGPDTFSCVGLMRYILRTIGTDSDAPWVPEEYLSRYPAVDHANLQPGDIVIYPG